MVLPNDKYEESESDENRGAEDQRYPALRPPAECSGGLGTIKCEANAGNLVPLNKKWSETDSDKDVGPADTIECHSNDAPRALVAGHTAELQSVAETLGTFVLSEKEVEDFKIAFAAELQRLTPGFFRAAALAALLPLIKDKSRAFYRYKNVPFEDADDLSSRLVEKIWKQLCGGWPHGNPGAWVATIRNSVLSDYVRAKERKKKRVINLTDKEFHNLRDESVDESSVDEMIEDLQVRSPEVIQQLLQDAKWPETVAYFQKRLDDAGKQVMSLEWDGQSAPLRKKRRSGGQSKE